jgi:copper chaperone CopZ
VALVTETLTEDLGVVDAVVNLEAGEAVVTYDPARHTVDDLCAAITASGYSATPRPA